METKKIVMALAAAALVSATGRGGEDGDAAQDWSRIYLGSVPSVNADGTRFIFEWNGSVWTASTAGGKASRLTRAESNEYWPMLSPDGKRMAFLSDRDGGTRLYEMDLATRETRRISPQDEISTLCGWLPDGKTVVANTQHGMDRPRRAARIAYIAPDGRETMPFTNIVSRFAAVSPDGALVAFTKRGEDIYRKRRSGDDSSDSEIWLYDAAKGSFEQAKTLSENALHPVWRPDGKAFYYLGRKRGDIVASVREYTLDGKKDREVVSFGEDAAFQPTLSADGRTMIVRAGFDFWRFDPTAGKAEPERIVMHPEGEQERQEAKRRRYYSAAWNNDYDGEISFCAGGRQFAFVCGGGLYAMDSAAKTPRLVSNGPEATGRPWRATSCAFSPDGSRLYAIFNSGDSTEICYFKRKDESLAWWENAAFEKKTIASGEATRRYVSVSPDGGRIAWADALGNLVFADPEGVVTGKGPVMPQLASYVWSPDGKYVAASLSDENANFDIWIVSTDGSRPPCNVSRNWKWDGEVAWSGDGAILAWTCQRPESGTYEIAYVYLDPKAEVKDRKDSDLERSRKENAEAAKKDGKKEDGKNEDKKDSKKEDGKESENDGKAGYEIAFDGIHERIRYTGLRGSYPFFSHDSRTLAYDTGSCTDLVRIPDKMRPWRLSGKRGRQAVWFKEGDRVAWCVNNLPAHKDDVFRIRIHREDDFADWRELAFRTAWARVRDKFYDNKDFHGADWKAVREKYLAPARHAASYSVFSRILAMMIGELDASHVDYYATDAAKREWVRAGNLHSWSVVCGDIGVAFEPGTFKVASVLRDSPAWGVLEPGDVVEAVNGEPLRAGDSFADRLVVAAGEKVQLTLAAKDKDAEAPKPVYVAPASRDSIRQLILREQIKAARDKVHAATGGRVGYIYINKMSGEDYKRFEDEAFSEAYDKDALIIDVRTNTGGFIADRVLSILCGGDHSRAISPTRAPGYLFSYWRRPVFRGGLVVLADENSFSNAEIFTHAVKTLKRGKVVGRKTAGGVIATNDRPLLDYGNFRDAFWGWFTIDGTDMENHGAEPDVAVDITPADEEAGRDPQLEAAIRVALETKPPKTFVPVYAK